MHYILSGINTTFLRRDKHIMHVYIINALCLFEDKHNMFNGGYLSQAKHKMFIL